MWSKVGAWVLAAQEACTLTRREVIEAVVATAVAAAMAAVAMAAAATAAVVATAAAVLAEAEGVDRVVVDTEIFELTWKISRVTPAGKT